MERKQKRREEVKRKIGDRSSSIKAEHSRSTTATVATASSLAKKARDPSIADTSRTYSDRRSRENKYSHSEPKSTGRVCT